MSVKSIVVVLFGLVGAVWRQYILRDSPLIIQQEAWTGWLGWALIYTGCRLYSWRRRTAHPSQQEQDGQLHDVPRSRNLKILGLSAAGIAAQIAQSRGIFAFVMVRRQHCAKRTLTETTLASRHSCYISRKYSSIARDEWVASPGARSAN
jgi:hypothetical protein